jgi:hypothetical protein
LTLLVHRRKPFVLLHAGLVEASRAFAIRKLLIAAACDTCIHRCHKPVRWFKSLLNRRTRAAPPKPSCVEAPL